MNMQSTTIPTPALVLGLAGLLPFFATAAAVCLLESARYSGSNTAEPYAHALGAYGAVILSFLGGVRWGKLLDDPDQLGQWWPLTLSVLPSLLAWPALLLDTRNMLPLLMAGFALQYLRDSSAVKRRELPAWFGRLRLILSSGALASLLLAWSTLK